MIVFPRTIAHCTGFDEGVDDDDVVGDADIGAGVAVITGTGTDADAYIGTGVGTGAEAVAEAGQRPDIVTTGTYTYLAFFDAVDGHLPAFTGGSRGASGLRHTTGIIFGEQSIFKLKRE